MMHFLDVSRLKLGRRDPQMGAEGRRFFWGALRRWCVGVACHARTLWRSELVYSFDRPKGKRVFWRERA